MQRIASAAAGVLLALAFAASANAQQQVEWKQTLNTPKGLNLPSGLKGELLGVELGDSYAEVKDKLKKLQAEGSGERAPPTEARMGLRMPVPGGTVDAVYIGQTLLIRDTPGSTNRTVHDSIKIKFSAPSSGHQVIGIERSIRYFVPGDQARVSEVLAAVKTKFKAEAQRVDEFTHRFMWDNGRSYVPPRVEPFNACRPQYGLQGDIGSIGSIINPKGDCDVVLDVVFQFGISKDHAESVTFILSDNERTKLNLTADSAFLDGYVRDLQNRTKGNAPKL
jgi:hypothetical protein